MISVRYRKFARLWKIKKIQFQSFNGMINLTLKAKSKTKASTELLTRMTYKIETKVTEEMVERTNKRIQELKNVN